MELVWVVSIAMGLLVVLALAVSGVVMLFIRLRSREPVSVNLGFLLRIYLYVAIIAGLIVLARGGSGLIQVGLAEAWGDDFSYWPVYVPLPEDRLPFTPDPLELRDPRTLSTAEQEQLARILADREAQRLELEERRMELGLSRAKDEGLLEGISFTIVGGFVLLAHVGGVRALAGHVPEEQVLSRVFLIGATVVFGVLTVVSLPQGVFDSLRFSLLDPLDEFGNRYQPGEDLALAIAATPIWLALLWATIKSVRAQQ